MRRDDSDFAAEASSSSRALGGTMLLMLTMTVGGLILLATGCSPAL
ncbi:hypothetical protein [Sphingomonas sp. 22176]